LYPLLFSCTEREIFVDSFCHRWKWFVLLAVNTNSARIIATFVVLPVLSESEFNSICIFVLLVESGISFIFTLPKDWSRASPGQIPVLDLMMCGLSVDGYDIIKPYKKEVYRNAFFSMKLMGCTHHPCSRGSGSGITNRIDAETGS
jgi:hypothetical protein